MAAGQFALCTFRMTTFPFFALRLPCFYSTGHCLYSTGHCLVLLSGPLFVISSRPHQSSNWQRLDLAIQQIWNLCPLAHNKVPSGFFKPRSRAMFIPIFKHFQKTRIFTVSESRLRKPLKTEHKIPSSSGIIKSARWALGKLYPKKKALKRVG